MKRYHVERHGCYVAGPFGSETAAAAWIAGQEGAGSLEIVPHDIRHDHADPDPDGCASTLAFWTLCALVGLAASWLHGLFAAYLWLRLTSP